jgi:hypothetical protein
VNKAEPKLQNQRQLRNKGAQRTQNFNSMRGFGGARMRAAGGVERVANTAFLQMVFVESHAQKCHAQSLAMLRPRV